MVGKKEYDKDLLWDCGVEWCVLRRIGDVPQEDTFFIPKQRIVILQGIGDVLQEDTFVMPKQRLVRWLERNGRKSLVSCEKHLGVMEITYG